MGSLRRIGALAIAPALVLVLAGCGDDEKSSDGGSATASTQGDDSGASENSSESGGSAGGGGLMVTVDGTPTADKWKEPLCAEAGSVVMISSDAGASNLHIQWPGKGSSSSVVVNLQLTGEAVELTNYAGGQASSEGQKYTFEGELTDSPHSPTVTHQVKIEVDCGA